MPFLTEVHFQNYRSFLDAKCRLSPVTVVIGANNAGKSNLLLGLLGIVEEMDERITVDATVHLDQAHCWKEGMNLADLRITVRTEGGFFDYHRYPAQERGGAWVWDRKGEQIVKGVAHYDIPQVFPVEDMAPAEEPFICWNLQGIYNVLRWLKATNLKVFGEIEAELKEHVAGLEELIVDEEVRVKQVGLDKLVPIDELSPGVQKMLLILCILYQAHKPELILLENIERDIHPRALKPVVETMRRISKEHEVQIIFTTQSPYVLDAFQEPQYWDDVVIVEKKNGVSTLTNAKDRLVALGYEREMEKVPLGDLWYSGLLGGVANGPPLWNKGS